MVEPLKPEDRARARRRGTEAEIAEYERLLSERFASDPSVARPEGFGFAAGQRQSRLKALARKLFGPDN